MSLIHRHPARLVAGVHHISELFRPFEAAAARRVIESAKQGEAGQRGVPLAARGSMANRLRWALKLVPRQARLLAVIHGAGAGGVSSLTLAEMFEAHENVERVLIRPLQKALDARLPGIGIEWRLIPHDRAHWWRLTDEGRAALDKVLAEAAR